jgi:hypothetical protein
MDNLGQIVDASGGIFSRAQALDCGETDRSLTIAVRDGSIVRLRRGIYAPADIVEACDAFGRHLLLARAALATQRGRVALAGASAAVLHGFALHRVELEAVHLVRLDDGSARSEAGIVHHGVWRSVEDDLGVYNGLPAVSPARTVWEVACRSSLEAGVVTADSALRQMPELREAIEDISRRLAIYPSSAKARTAIRLSDPLADSPGESVTRVQFFRFGFPCPELQHDVIDEAGQLVGRADFYWESCRHLGEFDGKIKYEALVRPDESASDAVVREKRREDRMRAGRRGMTRFTWAEVMPGRARRTMAELRAALEQSSQLYVRTGSTIAS